MRHSKYKNHQSQYINSFMIILIHIVCGFLFIVPAIGLAIALAFLVKYVVAFDSELGTMVSASVSFIIAIMALIPAIRKRYSDWVRKKRQQMYIFLCYRKSPLVLKTISNFNAHYFTHTMGQNNVITNAVEILRGAKQAIFAVESLPSKGKTTLAMLLLDSIGKEDLLTDLFIELHNQIYYFDCTVDNILLLDFLARPDLSVGSIILIDNVHKGPTDKLPQLLALCNNCVEYAQNIEQRCLIMLLYRAKYGTPSLSAIIRNFFDERGSRKLFSLNDKLPFFDEEIHNTKYDEDAFVFNSIQKENNEAARHHLLSVYFHSRQKKFFDFIKTVLVFNSISISESRFYLKSISFMAELVLLGSIYGYFSVDSLLAARKQRPNISLTNTIHLFHNNRFIQPFPLINNAYLLNEEVAQTYKTRLFKNKLFAAAYYEAAYNLYHSHKKMHLESRILYLFAMEPSKIEATSIEIRNDLLYKSLKVFSIRYVLQMLENEIEACLAKKTILGIELGTLLVRNGRWKEARSVLKPYIENVSNDDHFRAESVWELQLLIIEADHGNDDAENLNMLNQIINASKNEYTVFRADYWKTHINMELGNFNVDKWNQINNSIMEHPDWRQKSYYSVMLQRINSDYARTYFLSGQIDFEYYKKNVLDFYNDNDISTLTECNENPHYKLMSTALYLHYDVIYQLGLWDYFKHPAIDKKYIAHGNKTQGEWLADLIKQALEAYDKCIQTYYSEGDKKWRTVQIRRQELSVSYLGNYAEAISDLDSFSKYSQENGISVFDAYSYTMRSKFHILYALSYLMSGKISFFDFQLKHAKESAVLAQNICSDYGNRYGIVRAKIYRLIIEMLERRNNSVLVTGDTYKNYFSSKINKLKKECSEYKRECDILDFLVESNYSAELINLHNIVKFYPVILQ